MELPSKREDDFLYWKFHPSGRYTVKTGYYYLTKGNDLGQGASNDRDQKLIKLIWGMSIQPKWKIFLWKLYHDGIAVKANLANRGIEIDEICGYCGVELEDSQHLFRFCNLAKEVWARSALAICSDITGFTSLRRWIQYFILLFNSEDGKYSTRIVLFIATLWGLWKTRNARSFNDATGGTSMVMEFINQAMQDHETFTQAVDLQHNRENEVIDGPILPPGFNYIQLGKEKEGFDNFIVEVDGSWDKRTMRAGIGWSSKDNGGITHEGGRHGAANSALQCEAWACLEALKWAHMKGMQGILVLSNSISLLNNLQDQLGKDIEISWMIKEIKEVGASFKTCTVLKTQRDQVQRANDIARNCRINLLNIS